jgi:deoxyribodipyrimidine photo-lyase
MSEGQSLDGNSGAPIILWFRDDLRLADNPALDAAARSGRPILSLFIYDQVSPDIRKLGGAARWWLHGSLHALKTDLEAKGGSLLIFKGAAEKLLPEIIKTVGAKAIFWNRRYGEAERGVDGRLKALTVTC